MFTDLTSGKQSDGSMFFHLILKDEYGMDWFVYGHTAIEYEGFDATASPLYESRYANLRFATRGDNFMKCFDGINFQIRLWNKIGKRG